MPLFLIAGSKTFQPFISYDKLLKIKWLKAEQFALQPFSQPVGSSQPLSVIRRMSVYPACPD